ncbi:hypothetical protein [Pseudomonas syringae]|uniref:hypothetical protein n=1 Tax=Pseudomonas syringae TaxID=317 RepID=UPI0032D8E259
MMDWHPLSTRKTLTSCPGSVDHYTPRPPRKEPPPRKPRYNGADQRKYVEEEEDLALLKRIEAMRDLGVSHFKAENLTGINRTVIRRIVQQYSLDYPSSSRAK